MKFGIGAFRIKTCNFGQISSNLLVSSDLVRPDYLNFIQFWDCPEKPDLDLSVGIRIQLSSSKYKRARYKKGLKTYKPNFTAIFMRIVTELRANTWRRKAWETLEKSREFRSNETNQYASSIFGSIFNCLKPMYQVDIINGCRKLFIRMNFGYF